MEKLKLNNDIPVFFVTANSFPEGIIEAHQRLQSLVPDSGERRYFGISRPENGRIVYKAAIEEKNRAETKDLHLEKFIIRKGQYICLTIIDFTREERSIEKAFQKLISEPHIDPNGFCIEWYLPDGTESLSARDVRCMVKLSD